MGYRYSTRNFPLNCNMAHMLHLVASPLLTFKLPVECAVSLTCCMAASPGPLEQGSSVIPYKILKFAIQSGVNFGLILSKFGIHVPKTVFN